MAAPRLKYRERPKKLGAKKRKKVKAQKRRLIQAGLDEAKVNRLTDPEVRAALKLVARKK